MATVSIANDTLHVELRFWDKVLSVHGSLHIPLADIAAANADDAPPVPWFSKLIGLNMPGVAAKGTFFTHDGLAFYDYGAGHRCLVLDLIHDHYARAVVEIDPPQSAEEVAAQVTAALVARRPDAS
jgi:hypothetical protein